MRATSRPGERGTRVSERGNNRLGDDTGGLRHPAVGDAGHPDGADGPHPAVSDDGDRLRDRRQRGGTCRAGARAGASDAADAGLAGTRRLRTVRLPLAVLCGPAPGAARRGAADLLAVGPVHRAVLRAAARQPAEDGARAGCAAGSARRDAAGVAEARRRQRRCTHDRRICAGVRLCAGVVELFGGVAAVRGRAQ